MEMKIKLRPFNVPNFVLGELPEGQRQDGLTQGPSWRLSEVPAETLDKLCVEFRENVFKKAGIKDPYS